MYGMYDLSLFPLNTVLFPGVPIHLHIFEPRYRLMMHACIEQKLPFGVVLIREGMEALGPLPDPQSIGCTARIVDVERLPDGRMNLTALGDERFRILRLQHEHPFLTGQVEALPLTAAHSMELVLGVRALRQPLKRYLTILSKLENAELDLSDLQMPDDPLALVYLAASLLQLPAIEKQPLLEIDTASQLVADVRRLYQRENAIFKRLAGIGPGQAERFSWLN